MYIFSVPITTPTIPGPDEGSFLAYKTCKYQTYRDDIRQRFVPTVQTANTNAPFLRAPRLAV